MNRKTMLGDPPAIHLTQDDLGRLDALLSITVGLGAAGIGGALAHSLS